MVKTTSTAKTKPLATDDKNKTIEGNLRTVIENTIKYYNTYVFPEALEIIRYKQLDCTDRAIQLYKVFGKDYKSRSNDCYPLIAQNHDTFTANLYDTDTKARVVAFNEEDQDNAQMAQDFRDWAYGVANAFDELETIRNEASLIGTAYAMSPFRPRGSNVEYVKNWAAVSVDGSEDMVPALEHVNFFSLYLPPWTKDFYKSKYYIHRTIGAIWDYKKQYEPLWITRDNEDDLVKSAPISSVDYSRAYECRSYGATLLARLMSGDLVYKEEENWINEQMYYIDTAKNKLVECVEYYEWNNLAIFINGKMVYNGVGKAYFQCVINEKQPWTYRGRWTWHKLLPLQKAANLTYNGIKDAITMWLYPMFLIPKGTMKWTDGKTPTQLYYAPGKVIEVINNTGNAGIETLKFTEMSYIQQWQQHLEFLLSQADQVLWTNSYASWGQEKVERTSTGVNARVAVIRARLQPIINSLNRLNREIFLQWLIQATLYLDDDFKARITGEDGAAIWREVKIADIINKFDIIAENEANRLATKELRASQSLDALSKIQSLNVDQITWLPIRDLEPAGEYVMANLNFPALKKIDPAVLNAKVKQKAEFDAILKPQQANTAPPAPWVPIAPEALPTQVLPEAGPQTISWFSWALNKEQNRAASQIQ